MTRKIAHLFGPIATLLILTGCGWHGNISNSAVHVDKSTTDEEIRGQLLSFTPMGSAGTNVLKFVLDDLRPKYGAGAYFAYVDALQAGRTGRLSVVRFDFQRGAMDPPGSPPPPPTIDVLIGTYPEGMKEWRVSAFWTFDQNNLLTNLYVERDDSM